MTVNGLERECPVCARVSGDHTLREWATCLGVPTLDLPFEQVPNDAAALAAAAVREQFQLDPDLIVTDHVVIHAATLSGASGRVHVCVPTLLHEFQIGVSGSAPITVAKVAFISGIDGMRAYGRLVRDSANGAANASERAA